MDQSLLSEVRFMFAQSVFGHTIQNMAAVRKEAYSRWFNWFQIALTFAVIIILGVQAMGVRESWLNIIGIISAVMDLAFIVVNLTFGFSDQAAAHRTAARKYLALRGQYLSLITDIISSKTKSQLLYSRRDALNETYRNLSDSPPASTADYVDTQHALNTSGNDGEEQFTWSDTEIDRFLPSGLKKLPTRKNTTSKK